MSFLRDLHERLVGPGSTDRYWGWYEGGRNVTPLPFQEGNWARRAAGLDEEPTPGRWWLPALVGDALGAVGSALGEIKDEAIQPVVGQALLEHRRRREASPTGTDPLLDVGGFGIGSLLERGLERSGDLATPSPDTSAAAKALQYPSMTKTTDTGGPDPHAMRAARREYLRESTPTWVTGIPREVLTDPTSYFGGPVKNLPGALRSVGSHLPAPGRLGFEALAKAATPLAALDQAQMDMVTGVTNIVREVPGVVPKLPGIGKLFELDTPSAVQEIVDKIADGYAWLKVRPWAGGVTAPRQGGRGGRLGLPPRDTAKDLGHDLYAEIHALEDRLEQAHPMAAATALRLVGQMHLEKNLAERAVARRDFDAEMQFLSGALDKGTLGRIKERLWRDLHRVGLSSAQMTRELLDELDAIPWPALSPTAEAAARAEVRSAVTGTRQVAATARAEGQVYQAAEKLSDVFGVGPVGSASTLDMVAQTIDTALAARGTMTKAWLSPLPGSSARDDIQHLATSLQHGYGLSDEAGNVIAAALRDLWEVFHPAKGAIKALPPSLLQDLYKAAPGGIFSRSHLREVSDEAYASRGRDVQALVAGLQTSLDGILGPLTPPPSAGVARTADELQAAMMSRWQQRYGSLREVQQGNWSFSPHLPPENAAVMREYDRTINQSLDHLVQQRTDIMRETEEALRDHWTATGIPLPAQDARLLAAFQNGKTLLDELRKTGNRDLVARTTRTLWQYGSDLMDEDNLSALLMQDLTKRIAQQMGHKEPAGLAAAWRMGVRAWVNLALLSPKYLENNLISILFISHHLGMDSIEILRRIGEHSQDLARHLKENRLQEVPLQSAPSATSMPVAAAIGLADPTSGRIIQNPSFSRTTATNFASPGLSGPQATVDPTQSLSAIGRFNPAVRAAGFGGLMAGVGAATAPEDERLQRAVGGAAIGGAFGLGVGKLVYGLALLQSVIETAGRNTAWYHGLEQHMAGALPAWRDEVADYLASVSGRPPARALGVGGHPPLTFPTNQGNPGPVMAYIDDAVREITDHIAGRRPPTAAPLPDLSPDGLHRLLAEHGYRAEDANAIGQRLTTLTQQAMEAGTQLSNRANIDYGKQTKIEAWLKNTGIMPFVTWQARMYPIFLHILATHPAYLAAIHSLSTISEDDARRGGLTERYAMMAKTGALGAWLAEHLLDTKGDILVNPVTMFFPFADVARATPERDEGNRALLDGVMDQMAKWGMGVSPLVTVPAEATGLLSPRGGNVIRTTPMLSAATTAIGAGAIDLEAPIREGVRAVRAVVGAENQPTVTGSPMYDWQIRSRIAEMALERSRGARDWRTEFGPGVMDDPQSPIWREAQAHVDRANAGLTLLNQGLPPRLKLQSQGEQRIRGAMRDAGTTPEQLRGLLPHQIAGRRIEAARANPTASGYTNLGSDPAGRLWAEWRQVEALIGQLPPEQQKGWREYYLRRRPQLRAILGGGR